MLKKSEEIFDLKINSKGEIKFYMVMKEDRFIGGFSERDKKK